MTLRIMKGIQHSFPTGEAAVPFVSAALGICSFMSALDTVILASTLPKISHALHASSINSFWCATGFLFAETIGQPLYGVMSPVVGMKTCIIAAVIIFTVASLLCGAAQNVTWLIAARVMQGFGAGGIDVMVLTLISEIVPLAKRGNMYGIMSLCSAVGLVSGVVLGAVIAERATWRIAFYMNIPICIVALLALSCFLHLPGFRPPLGQSLKAVDWIGVTVLSGSLVGILYGVTGGGILYPWSSAQIVTALSIGFLGIVFFVYHEHRIADRAIIPLRVFSSRTAASGYFTIFLQALILRAIAYYLILYFIIAKRHSLIGAAVATLPGLAVVPPMAAVGGFLMSMTERFMPFNLFSWVCMASGVGLLSTLTPSSPLGKHVGYQILVAVGGGISYPGRILAVQAPQQNSKDIPIATTMVSFFTSLGEAFGMGVAGTIFQITWDAEVDRQIARGSLREADRIHSRDAEGESLQFSTLPKAVMDAYGIVISRSLRIVWITLAALAATACVVTLLQKNLSTAAMVPDEDELIETPDTRAIVTQKS